MYSVYLLVYIFVLLVRNWVDKDDDKNEKTLFVEESNTIKYLVNINENNKYALYIFMH